MDGRGKLCCLCWFSGLTVVNFLIALLVAYKTLTGECEHPEDICYNNAKCYTDYEGFICECLPGFKGRRCEYLTGAPAPTASPEVHLPGGQLNGSFHILPTNFNDSYQIIPSHSTTPPVSPGKEDSGPSRIDMDRSFGPPYWKFVVVYGTTSSLFFIITFIIFYFVNQNCMDNKKSKDFYGIKYEQASQGQVQHLISNASILDNNV